MLLARILRLLFLALVGCSSRREDNGSPDDAKRQSIINNYLNKKKVTTEGNYYTLRQASDSTAEITWGNEKLNRVYGVPLDFMFVERLYMRWENKNYLLLEYATGSNAWATVVLPINSKQPTQVFINGLYFDAKNNLLVTEEVGDTVLAIHNLHTLQSQFVVEKEHACASGNNYACLDTITIVGKELYYKWAAPRNFSDRDSSTEKRVHLKI